MPLVFACIAPHGFPLIPDLSPDAEGAMPTRAALEEVGRRSAAAGVEALIVAGPHGVRVEGAICLGYGARAVGTLQWKGRQVEMNVPTDPALVDALTAEAGLRGIPVALASYGGNRREQSAVPLDWGALVPLWFLGHGRNMPGSGDVLGERPREDSGPPVAVATPSRRLGRDVMVEFGRAIAAVAKTEPRRIGFVASCDWAHTHRADGPYGFHPAAETVDRLVVEAIREGRPGSLIGLDEGLVEDGAIDGLWQTLMLAGALEETGLVGELLSYEAPTYYGMLVAAYGVG